jgi:hypothetical protein
MQTFKISANTTLTSRALDALCDATGIKVVETQIACSNRNGVKTVFWVKGVTCANRGEACREIMRVCNEFLFHADLVNIEILKNARCSRDFDLFTITEYYTDDVSTPSELFSESLKLTSLAQTAAMAKVYEAVKNKYPEGLKKPSSFVVVSECGKFTASIANRMSFHIYANDTSSVVIQKAPTTKVFKNEYETMRVNQLRKGEFFKKNNSSKIVWVLNKYVASVKKYSCYKFDDVNHEQFISGNKEIFTNFEF